MAGLEGADERVDDVRGYVVGMEEWKGCVR
jgi:hypothetical protein